MKYLKEIALVNTAVLFLILMGCQEDKPTEAEMQVLTPTEAVKEGWGYFEQGQYNTAVQRFTQAITSDANLAEAYQGLGWSYARIDSLSRADINFRISLTIDDQLIDSYAGHAFVSFQLNNFNMAIFSANKALSEAGEFYVFKHDPSVSASDLHLLLAQCYFELGNYAYAQAQVDILVPNNTLDPKSATYVQELCALIESLNGKV